MRVLYNFGINAYLILIRLIRPFNPKAQLWLKGRENIFQRLGEKIDSNKELIWFHCASLGEFEQAKPLILKYRTEAPNKFLLLTFFSPSGYEIQKNFKEVDAVFYLPIDTPNRVKQFLTITKPSLAIFIKYEFWFNYLNELKRQSIRTFLISGIFRPQQAFFKFYGSWFRKHLSAFEHFFLQDKRSVHLLHSIGFENCSKVGDTRFDRVLELIEEPFENRFIQAFVKDQNKVLVFGSSWQKENEIAQQLVEENLGYKLIIAPHEIHSEKMKELQIKFGSNAVLYSSITSIDELIDKQVLIIDQIGMLSKIYRFGIIAIIGGGFGAGIHNTLEAAVYGKPVLFGPNHEKYKEAVELIQVGAAFPFSDYPSFKKILERMSSSECEVIGAKAAQYVKENTGASSIIFSHLIS